MKNITHSATTTYYAIAGSDVAACVASNWATLSIRPYVLAEGDDQDSVVELATVIAGHDDIYLHAVLGS